MPDRPDPALEREREHLRLARSELARMRERTLALEAWSGDKVSAEYLKSALYHRARALVDDPSTTLFFGRTDHTNGERWYIGRRHVADADGDPVVVDWRADVSRPFYRASRADPQTVVLRRRFGVEQGQLTAYEDEHLAAPADGDVDSRHSRIVAREIERPRVGPMRDIVATIQPEQDEIVRSDVATTVCVQGAPGTGKTAVGLHRAAWLLYAYRERLARGGVLVVGPNEAFLEHVGAVLPALGEVEVRHTTVENLVARRPVRGSDPVVTATLKGDARMATVLHRAVWSHVNEPAEPLVLPRGSRRWRVGVSTLGEIVGELRQRGVRYAAARSLLSQRFAHSVLVKMESAGESPDDRVQDAVARCREVKAMVNVVWPAVDPARLLWRLFTDGEFLAACADGVLDSAEQAVLSWPKAPRSPAAARWSAADVVLFDELADILERTPSLGHVVLDEAQDLSPMQLRAVGRRCSTGSATVLGDLAQGTTPWATSSWPESLQHLGKETAHLEVLDRGFRVPARVLDYATRLLPVIAPGLAAPQSVREDPGELDVTHAANGRLWQLGVRGLRLALDREGSVALVVVSSSIPTAREVLARNDLPHHTLGEAHPDWDGHPPRVSLVPAPLAKGLEFDRVVVIEPADIVAAEPDERTGLRRLYVVLTRAVTGLAVVHSRPLPPALAE